MVYRLILVLFISQYSFSQLDKVGIEYNYAYNYCKFDYNVDLELIDNHFGVDEHFVAVNYTWLRKPSFELYSGINFRMFSYRSIDYQSALNNSVFYYNSRIGYFGIPLSVNFNLSEKWKLNGGINFEFLIFGKEKQKFKKGSSLSPYESNIEKLENFQVSGRLGADYIILDLTEGSLLLPCI